MFSVMLLSTVEAAGSQITLEESGVLKTMEAMWTAISTTVTNFFTSVLTPVINFATTNPLTLIFSVSVSSALVSGICAVLLMRSGAVADRGLRRETLNSGGLINILVSAFFVGGII